MITAFMVVGSMPMLAKRSSVFPRDKPQSMRIRVPAASKKVQFARLPLDNTENRMGGTLEGVQRCGKRVMQQVFIVRDRAKKIVICRGRMGGAYSNP